MHQIVEGYLIYNYIDRLKQTYTNKDNDAFIGYQNNSNIGKLVWENGDESATFDKIHFVFVFVIFNLLCIYLN